MRVELYERLWMWASLALIVVFLGALLLGAAVHAIHPPSHLETIDPLRVRTDSEFARPGVLEHADGRVRVVLVAEMFRFVPAVVRVPAGRPLTIRVTSPDVLHGLQIVGTNVNTTVAPGYVSELTVTLPRPGEYLVVCNEYCGLSHHLMSGRLLATAPEPGR